MGSNTLWGVFRASEIVCIPDVSANSVLVLFYMAIIRLGHRNMS